MSSRLLVATRKGLFLLRHGGTGNGRWRIDQVHFLGDPVTMVLSAGESQRVYAALDHGHFGVKLHCSDDQCESWQEIAAPEYPPKPKQIEETDPYSGQPIPWSLKRIWSMATGPDGALWAGTMPGGLFRSEDDGRHWALIRSLWDHPARKRWGGGGADWPGIHSILVDPRDADDLIVAVSVGGVWGSTDGGESWVSRTEGMWAAYWPPEQAREPAAQDAHCVVQCPAAPQVLWCQHHNAVFRSTDRGLSWREIETVQPSVFGFAVAVHPSDPETAWLVPAAKDEQRIPVGGALVVARTRDGGESFEVLRKGLPQEHAYDLVYRHALDVDASGDRLALGSTTGGLWISENQGDDWQELEARLPPVYCVRFL